MAGNGSVARPTAHASTGPTLQQLARAVAFCYDDTLKDEEIATILGVTRRTLARWKHHELWGPMYLAASEFFRLQLDRKYQTARGYTWPLQLDNARRGEG